VKETSEEWARWRKQRWSEKQEHNADLNIKRAEGNHLLRKTAPIGDPRAGRRAARTAPIWPA
jgi:hypothetical protein